MYVCQRLHVIRSQNHLDATLLTASEWNFRYWAVGSVEWESAAAPFCTSAGAQSPRSLLRSPIVGFLLSLSLARSGSHKTKCGRTLPTGPLFNLLVALGEIRIGPSGLRLKYSGHYTVPNVITAVENIIWNILLFILGFRGPQGSGYHLAALSKMVEPSEEYGYLSDDASYRSRDSIIHPRLDSKHTKEAEWAQLLPLHEPLQSLFPDHILGTLLMPRFISYHPTLGGLPAPPQAFAHDPVSSGKLCTPGISTSGRAWTPYDQIRIFQQVLHGVTRGIMTG